MWQIPLETGRVSGGKPELSLDACDPPSLAEVRALWGNFLCGYRSLQDHRVSGKDHEPLHVDMEGAEGKTWKHGSPASCRSHPRQRAVELILQAVGNGKEFKPILSDIQSLDNLTKSA